MINLGFRLGLLQTLCVILSCHPSLSSSAHVTQWTQVIFIKASESQLW